MSTECVLLVDSDFDSRNVYQAILVPNGYHVLEASDGEAALRLAAEAVPKIIISEFVLPRLDGLALLERLRQDPRTASIPFIILSATESSTHWDRALSLGCLAWLLKPRTPSEILVLVDTLRPPADPPRRRSASRRAPASH